MHKITVGICDDDSKWSEKAKKLILNYGKKTSTVIEVFCVAGKEDLESYQGEPGSNWHRMCAKSGRSAKLFIYPITFIMQQRFIKRRIFILC